MAWVYKHDPALRVPYDDKISALIHEPSFKQAAAEAVFSKARVINTLGNRAVHGHRTVPSADALVAVRELFADDHDRKALLVMATGAGKTRTGHRRCGSADAARETKVSGSQPENAAQIILATFQIRNPTTTRTITLAKVP